VTKVKKDDAINTCSHLEFRIIQHVFLCISVQNHESHENSCYLILIRTFLNSLNSHVTIPIRKITQIQPDTADLPRQHYYQMIKILFYLIDKNKRKKVFELKSKRGTFIFGYIENVLKILLYKGGSLKRDRDVCLVYIECSIRFLQTFL